MKRVFVFGVVFMLGLVGVASAQEDLDAITWLAYEKTESGKSRELIGASIKDDGPMYDEMLKNGTLSSWGIAIPINHHLSDDWNYMLWATMAGSPRRTSGLARRGGCSQILPHLLLEGGPGGI